MKQAAEAYREALKEETRERAPLKWAAIQSALGETLQRLGKLENRIGWLEQATEAYHEALKERPRERVPGQWHGTAKRLLSVLAELGMKLMDAGQTASAVGRFKEATDFVEEIVVDAEQRETERTGKAGKQTAEGLGFLAWIAFAARDFGRAGAARQCGLNARSNNYTNGSINRIGC